MRQCFAAIVRKGSIHLENSEQKLSFVVEKFTVERVHQTTAWTNEALGRSMEQVYDLRLPKRGMK
jgi:hypothetical protein